MASFNKVILVGNLTRDPEVKYVTSGTAVTELGLAVNRTWFDKQQNQKREETTFVDVTLWARQAEVGDKHIPDGVEQHVVGFDVAMDDAAIVQGTQRVGERFGIFVGLGWLTPPDVNHGEFRRNQAHFLQLLAGRRLFVGDDGVAIGAPPTTEICTTRGEPWTAGTARPSPVQATSSTSATG